MNDSFFNGARDAPLTSVSGLGDDAASALASHGVDGTRDLAKQTPEDVAEAASVEAWRAEGWIEKAKEALPDESEESVARSRSEGRASGRDGASEADSDPTPDPTPDSEFERLYEDLTPNQKKVVQEYPFHATKADTARAVGLSPSCVYSWPQQVWDAGEALLDERAQGIQTGMSALSPAAIDVMRRALDPGEEVSRVEAESAQYLINQLEGKATQKSEVDVSGGLDVPDSDAEELDAMLAHLEEEGGDEGDKDR